MQFTTGAFTMAYEEAGRGVPLVCLSAFPFDGVMWREQWALRDTARVIIPNYRGHDGSSFTDGPYTMELLARDMVALLDHLQIDKAVFMGCSVGCYVAFALYADCADRVRGLVLADTRAEADNPATQERRRKTVEGLRAEGVGILDSRIDALFSPVTRQQRPELVQEMRDSIKGANPEALAQLTLGMAARPDRTGLLPQIIVPTLVLCGEDDTVSPPDGMRALAAQIPGARFTLIPQAGHLAVLEQPAVVNGAVREFLNTR